MISDIDYNKRVGTGDNSAIVKQINDSCYGIAIMNPGDDEQVRSQLKKLTDTLRFYFHSEYCAIGKVDSGFVEDCVVSWLNSNDEDEYIVQERDLKSVKRIRVENQKCCVCRGLESSQPITYYSKEEINGTDNFGVYEKVLGEVRNTTIIPIRDKNSINKGFIQIINSQNRIKYDDISSFYDRMLGLILFIHLRDGLKDANLFKNDYDFISKIQSKIDNVDSLLKEIMIYLSKEFSAGVISYRIPLLVGTENDKKPLFYLRDCYIKKEISKYYTLDDYFRERLVKSSDQMGGFKKLACNGIEPVIIDEAMDSDYYKFISDESIVFRDDTLIIPVLRDYSEKDECFYPKKKKEYYCFDEASCPFRFARYFGVFKLRILRDHGLSQTEHEGVDEWLSDETKKRLENLAKHISTLLNAIVDKNENKSLDIFRKELKGTSFTKIKDFDEQCSIIVKKAIHTNKCAIYRYKDNKLTFSASSDLINDDFNEIIEKYGIHGNNLVKTLFAEKRPVYYVRNNRGADDSIMIVPMMGKNNTKLGVMLLIGKETTKMDLSRTYWEHDKDHIEFIVDMMTRIEESDSERLTFLSQLSHELRRPVEEMVLRNEYHIKTATRNVDTYSKRNLINEMQNNYNMCNTFKYIIEDVELIYSLSKGEVHYDFEMVDFKKEVIVNSIRLFENEARVSKSIEIKTYLAQMPEKLYIDKSRMMQVVINLLKNAIQYSLPNEEISISYEYDEKEDCHEINFSNKGIPINSKEKESIFDMFFRSKQAVEKRPNGTGIGLYLVKQIMKAHGGDCFVKELSFPTTITIQIPNKKINHEESANF